MKYAFAAIAIAIALAASTAHARHGRPTVVHMSRGGALIMYRQADGRRYFSNVDFTSRQGSTHAGAVRKHVGTDRSTRAPGNGAATYGGGPVWIENPFVKGDK